MTSNTDSITYATPITARPSLRLPALLVVLAIGLFGISGCFMMGVGLALDLVGYPPANPVPWTFGEYAYVGVLYAYAGISFIAGGWVTIVAVKRLRD